MKKMKIKPKIMMVATKPPQDVHPLLFQTIKIYQNMPEFMFVKIKDGDKPLSFVKNDDGDVVPEDAKSNAEGSEATAEPIFGSDLANPEEEIDKRYQRFLRMSEQERDTLTCDDAFVLYLGDVSKYVNPTYYKIVLRFIVLYRECLNELGW